MFEYRITWYNDCTESEEFIRGIVCGKNYADVAEKITREYGEREVTDLYLQAFDNGDVSELNVIKEQFNL